MDGVGAKAELRARMRSLRSAMPETERAGRGAAAGARLLGLPEIEGGTTILLFYAFGEEPATAGVVEGLRNRGVRVLLPRMESGSMEVAEAAGGMRPSSFGAREPLGPAVDPAEIDAVVVPGLAFDRFGNRLGRGGGHYDRFLAALPERVARIGLAYSHELVDAVPARSGDERVDIVVTDTDVVRVPKSRPL